MCVHCVVYGVKMTNINIWVPLSFSPNFSFFISIGLQTTLIALLKVFKSILKTQKN